MGEGGWAKTAAAASCPLIGSAAATGSLVEPVALAVLAPLALSAVLL